MRSLPSQANFLERYRIDADAFDATGIAWADLGALFDHYNALLPELESIGEMMSNRLMKVDKVHSVRYRVKDGEHLIEKIIRKRIQKPEREITKENYLLEITDLVGLRAIHLFKEDWESIHEAISQIWDLKETAKAYIRAGDNELYRKAFSDKGLIVEEHERGYRSIHYNAKTKPGKSEYLTEIQVRTIFEEGWSEIDHSIRYPYDLDNLLYQEFSMILNRLAGSADEMGSFITLLRHAIAEYDRKGISQKHEIERLLALVDKPELDAEDKDEIKKGIAEVATLRHRHPYRYGTIPIGVGADLSEAIRLFGESVSVPLIPQSTLSEIAGLASTLAKSNLAGLQGLVAPRVTPTAPKSKNKDKSKGDDAPNDDNVVKGGR